MAKLVSVSEAVEHLNSGGLVGLPTETVYGLAARVDQDSAIANIFRAKQRPFFDPLIVHVHSLEQAKTLCSEWPSAAEVLSKYFWPGPLTLVLPKKRNLSEMITSGLPTVGIRWPASPIAQEIIRQVGVPLAAPSANQFGKTSPTKAQHVLSEFSGQSVYVVDGGDCEVGIESTIVSVGQDGVLQILRPGQISEDKIAQVLAQEEINFRILKTENKLMAPGQMKHHYMPTKPLVLVDEFMSVPDIIEKAKVKIIDLPEQEESVKLVRPSKIETAIELVLPDEASLAARCFYSRLREQSELQTDILFFRLKAIHSSVEWSGIMDRLNKASSVQIF